MRETRVILTVLTGPLAGHRLCFDGPTTCVVGRQPDCELQLPSDEAGVSRRHAAFDFDPPAVRVRDLGGVNGTWVNDRHVGERTDGRETEADLAHDDRVVVGETVLLVSIEAPVGVERALRCACGRIRPATRQHADGVGCGECAQTVRDTPAEFDARAEHGLDAFPGHRIVRVLGAGGMGKVYLALEGATGEQVALKVLLSQVAVDESNRRGFLREMEVAGALEHPNLVRRRVVGNQGRTFWFSMDYCPGGNLADLVQRRGGPLAPEEAVPLIIAALEGLAFMHERGFIHRDLKPQNILLDDPMSRPMLADFGLAKSFEQAGLTGLTVTGSVRGTPHFTPREQVTNYKYVKPVSDVWSMGATLYYLLSGDVPRGSTGVDNPMLRALTTEPTPLVRRAPRIPTPLCEVVDRAVATDPTERFPSARALQRALEAAL